MLLKPAHHARSLVLLFCFVSFLSPVNAETADLVVDANGILKGATGVLVNGHLYDVEFVEGTCAQVFGVCDEAHFAFTTESAALAASKALLDYVFLNVPGVGEFDSDPTLTHGCFLPANCWALTPYKIMGDGFLITQTHNTADDDGYFVFQPDGPGLSISGYDASADVNGVFAKWTARPDDEPGPPCVYTFTAGSGAAFISYCLSENGTIVRLGGPTGQEHINVGQIWEGYVVCSGVAVQAWDLSSTGDGFDVPSVLKDPTSTAVTLRRSSYQYQLDQAFTLDKKEKDITITMTLTNISGSMIPDVRIARTYDPDINNDFLDDLEAKSSRAVWAGDIDAVTLMATTWAFPTNTAIDTGPGVACSPPSAGTPRITGDASLAYVTYRVGNMAAGAKKRVVFVYRVQ